MSMNRFSHLQRRSGIKGFLFPYTLNRIELLVRALIIGVFIYAPLYLVQKTSTSNQDKLNQQVATLTASLEKPPAEITTEKFDEWKHQLDTIVNKTRLNSALLLISFVLSFAVYVMSFWMMFIPRLKSMGQSPKLALLMAVPVVNVLFAWVLILAPPKL